MSRPEGSGFARNARAALSVLLIAMYVAGLIAMFAGAFRLGLYLWVFSTVAGIGLLYWIRTMNKREEDAGKIAKGMPYGEPDDPVAGVNPAVPEEEAEAPGEPRP